MTQDSTPQITIPLRDPLDRKRGLVLAGVSMIVIGLMYVLSIPLSHALIRLGNYASSAENSLFASAINKLALELNRNLKQSTYQCYNDNVNGQYSQAVIQCSKAIEIEPNYGYAYFIRGFAYSSLKQYDLAIADYTKDIELIPISTRSYINRGLSFMKLKRYDLAIEDFNRSIEINPNEPQPYLNRGLVYIVQGKYDLAVSDCGKAVEIEEKYWNGYLCLGLAYTGQEKYDLAVTNMSKAIELKPDDSFLLLSRGTNYAKQKKYDLAIADLTNAIKIEPNSSNAYTERGNAFADTQQFSLAIADYQKAITLTADLQENAYNYCVEGITYTKMEEFALAITALENGTELDQANAYPWCMTALENARQGIPTP
jgi:tetratricopeptide (TPR) repeat protein